MFTIVVASCGRNWDLPGSIGSHHTWGPMLDVTENASRDSKKSDITQGGPLRIRQAPAETLSSSSSSSSRVKVVVVAVVVE